MTPRSDNAGVPTDTWTGNGSGLFIYLAAAQMLRTGSRSLTSLLLLSWMAERKGFKLPKGADGLHPLSPPLDADLDLQTLIHSMAVRSGLLGLGKRGKKTARLFGECRYR